MSAITPSYKRPWRLLKKKNNTLFFAGSVFVVFIVALFIVLNRDYFSKPYIASTALIETILVQKTEPDITPKKLDIADYDKRMVILANNSSTTASTTKTLWPAKTVYPNAGAILPFNRIVAYYGNFYSKGMGVLGQYPQSEMLARLDGEVKKWGLADPTTPVVPAINYIVVTAQGYKGDGKYRLRMPDSQIDIAVKLAKEIHGIVILDVQVGLSNLETEIPLLEKYLKMPEVHLGLDPEFSMKTGAKPGTVIGTMNARDINYVATYLAKLVRDNDLPPKVIVVHRFTENMLTGYKQIKPLPEVQIVMDMDGWGSPAKKKGTYRQVVYPEPIQFTGFKLFYKNDLRAPSTRMMTQAEVLALQPIPSFIQYQ
jgi:hypothetical protein